MGGFTVMGKYCPYTPCIDSKCSSPILLHSHGIVVYALTVVLCRYSIKARTLDDLHHPACTLYELGCQNRCHLVRQTCNDPLHYSLYPPIEWYFSQFCYSLLPSLLGEDKDACWRVYIAHRVCMNDCYGTFQQQLVMTWIIETMYTGWEIN